MLTLPLLHLSILTPPHSASAFLFGILPKMSLSEEGKKKSNYMKMMEPASADAHH
jgi:hypothetical protein